MALLPDTLLKRYLALRGPLEALFCVLLCGTQAAANTLVTVIDVRQNALPFAPWEIATWEFSSNAVWLVLIPAVVWVLDRKPLRWGLLARHLPWHAAASLVFCAVHVAGMVALRQAVYALRGFHYNFGPWVDGLFYEALKDIRGYAFTVALVMTYRLLLWRWQGEARWLDAPDGVPGPATPAAVAVAVTVAVAAASPAPPASPPPPAPDRILVKKLGKEFLLPTAEVEWVQACGNYVNLHRQQHDYPLRTTLAAIEQRLDANTFVRVHRSYLVNLALVQVIEPNEAGDARLRLRDGATVPCSRTYLEALRQRLGATPHVPQHAAPPAPAAAPAPAPAPANRAERTP